MDDTSADQGQSQDAQPVREEISQILQKSRLVEHFADLYDDDDTALLDKKQAEARQHNLKNLESLASAFHDDPIQPGVKGTAQENPVEDPTIAGDDTESCTEAGSEKSRELARGNAAGKATENGVEDGDVVDMSDVDLAWLGTSQFDVVDRIKIQKSGKLPGLIAWRQEILTTIKKSPYNPTSWVDLANVYQTLGFSEISAATAYKALILCRVGKGIKIDGPFYPTKLPLLVRELYSNMYRTHGLSLLQSLMTVPHILAMRALLSALMSCASYYEGWMIATEATKELPGRTEFLNWKRAFHIAYKDQRDEMIAYGAKPEVLKHGKCGGIYTKPYPWLDEKFSKRPEELVKTINKTLANQNVEVKPVSTDFEDGREDVGCLGMFAIRDLKAGEPFLIDETALLSPEVSSKNLENCDACNAALCPPFYYGKGWTLPCCLDVKYCSKKCRDMALDGYHGALCQKDWDWLYENEGDIAKTKGAPASWQSRMFLRAFAMIRETDLGESESPLTHHILRRLTANYPQPTNLTPEVKGEWCLADSVIGPFRILQSMSVDIWTDEKWTPEVIQTALWRMDNNANSSKNYHKEDRNEVGADHIVALNMNYIFFNHSCQPNVVWHGWPAELKYLNLQAHYMGDAYVASVPRYGSSAVICKAARDVKRGEELKISYIGDPMGEDGKVAGGREARRYWLGKWLENGCGCRLCEAENVMKEAEEKKRCREEAEREEEERRQAAKKCGEDQKTKQKASASSKSKKRNVKRARERSDLELWD
ncbi:Wd tetratricopeptide repeat domain-containing protein [Phlyctema vagabunda]|uniref:Wd tetratricopeptide repeat domain-containing protein n=1 Tax=Phlyctema vagabunda TaxID=108571 RepID=A0ABR4PIG5_9HELO